MFSVFCLIMNGALLKLWVAISLLFIYFFFFYSSINYNSTQFHYLTSFFFPPTFPPKNLSLIRTFVYVDVDCTLNTTLRVSPTDHHSYRERGQSDWFISCLGWFYHQSISCNSVIITNTVTIVFVDGDHVPILRWGKE